MTSLTAELELERSRHSSGGTGVTDDRDHVLEEVAREWERLSQHWRAQEVTVSELARHKQELLTQLQSLQEVTVQMVESQSGKAGLHVRTMLKYHQDTNNRLREEVTRLSTELAEARTEIASLTSSRQVSEVDRKGALDERAICSLTFSFSPVPPVNVGRCVLTEAITAWITRRLERLIKGRLKPPTANGHPPVSSSRRDQPVIFLSILSLE